MRGIRFWLIGVVSFITATLGTFFVSGSFFNRALSTIFCAIFSFSSTFCTLNLGVKSDPVMATNTPAFEKIQDVYSDVQIQEPKKNLLAFESFDNSEGHQGITFAALGQINKVGNEFTIDAKREIDRADRQVDLEAKYLNLTDDGAIDDALNFSALLHGMFSSDFNKPYKHFGNEKFKEDSKWLIDQQDDILAQLKIITKENEAANAKEGAGLKARQLLGQALHTVQDFYAHSNWIELGHIKDTDTNKDLGVRRLCSYPDQVACADRDEPTAKEVIKIDNGLVSGKYVDYDQSILDPNLKKLTSGYFMGVGISTSGSTSIREFCDAPKGKVYHGAFSCPGFNHDKPNDPKSNYIIAKALAIEASKDYINLITEDLMKDQENGLERVKALMGIQDDSCKSQANQNKEECKLKEGKSTGDPHLATFDGLKYDLQTIGEVILIKSNDGSFEVQARQAPFGSSFSIDSAVAVKVGSDRVALYAREFPDSDTINPLRVNGKSTTIQGGKLSLSGGGEIARQGDTYVISSPTGEKVVVSQSNAGNNAFFNISPYVYNRAGKYSGLLGNVNGNPKDDLQIRGGNNVLEFRSTYGDVNQVLNLAGLRLPGVLDTAEKLYFDQLYKDFGNSWRVKQEESLFDYPAGKTTKNYTDPSFPDKYLTLNMLSPDQIQKARNACNEAKVAQDLIEGCIFDVGFSGYSDFARATAEISGYVNIVNQLFPSLNIPTPDQAINRVIQQVVPTVPKVCLPFIGCH